MFGMFERKFGPATILEDDVSARQPRRNDKTRIHIHVEDKKLKVIDKAAEALGLSRAYYIGTVAFAAAESELAQQAKKKPK